MTTVDARNLSCARGEIYAENVFRGAHRRWDSAGYLRQTYDKETIHQADQQPKFTA